MKEVLRSLNPQQQQAVTTGDGPVLIVAGPGTGKTKTLTARIGYLLERGVAADDILALTFTNKAAHEMQRRVGGLLGPGVSLPKITTFHALGYELLSRELGKVNLITEAERSQLIRDLPKPAALKGITTRELGLMISRAKTSLKSAIDPAVTKLLDQYEQALQTQHRLDFDDLLRKTYDFLTSQPAKRPRYQHLLVDEFQDTSELQYALLPLLCATQNVFVIGDPNQSIYAFRGAGAEMFERFQADFPDHQTITLGTNYRSTPAVVSLANTIFATGPALQAHRQDAGLVRTVQVLNEYSEASFILDTIERRTGGSSFLTAQAEQDGARLKDFAVLYRTHRVAHIIRDRFAESGIPHQVVGEGSPYDRPEVQALRCLLRELATGDKSLRKTHKLLTGYTDAQLDTVLASLRPTSLAICDVVQQLVERLGFGADKPKIARDLQHFIGTLVRFDTDLKACIDHLDRIDDSDFYDPDLDAVTLLTIHAAKGLEFAHVFLAGAEEGILPHIRKNNPTNLDEERRLFYVAATRARNQLDMLHAQKRAGQPTAISSFITSLPAAVLPRQADPALAAQQTRLNKRALKRSQTSLF